MSRADLYDRVAGDLAGCRLHRVQAGLALVGSADGPRCWWTVRADRRRLLVIQSSRFHLDGPPTRADTRIVLQHTGNLRRTGLRARVTGREQAAGEAMRDQLLADGELQDASLGLDFTSFVVAPVEGWWRAQLELMGGSYVQTRLPPASNYIRLADDQVRSLLATVAVLHRRLPAAPERLAIPAPTTDTGRADHHLPGRNA